MINTIHTWNIFDPHNIILGEHKKIIVCWTNTDWINNSNDWVAWTIWKSYSNKFKNLWKSELWDININSTSFADFVAITTNERKESEHNWENVDYSLSEWFQKIYNQIILGMKKTYTLQQLLDQFDWNTVEKINFDKMDIGDITNTIETLKTRLNEILPPIRTVLIWGWKSWKENMANMSVILKTMHQSPLNLHLFLKDEQKVSVMEAIKIAPQFYKEANYEELLLA